MYVITLLPPTESRSNSTTGLLTLEEHRSGSWDGETIPRDAFGEDSVEEEIK